MAICLFDPAITPLILRGRSKNHLTFLAEREKALKEKASGDRWLHCINCRIAITSDDQGISVNSSHVHTFSNPAGLTFRIGCFSGAPGCLFHEDPTSQHSWFPGYSWQYADCSGCSQHLGWQFIGKKETDFFSGLILNRLTTLSRPPAD
jgi:hypothetical protein